MEEYIDPRYPDIDYLKVRAQKRIPGFAFDYLDGGCNNEVNLKRNTEEIRGTRLKPYYIRKREKVSLKTSFLGQTYDAPFGMAPIGLQGLMWPGATEILAKAAFDYNIPFILSTVATASLEKVSEITEGQAWFQLYHPVDKQIRNDILKRMEASGYETLVILCDVPSFGYRSKEIKNGLAIPPRMNMRNIFQILNRPTWAVNTLLHGHPDFKTLKPYMPKGMNLRHLGLFMNKMFSGKLNEEMLAELRDEWKGKIVLKGVASIEDTEQAIKLGFDGVIVSNHGGRQLDHGQAAITALKEIAMAYGDRIEIAMDSGIRTGPDIVSTLANGAAFTFLGRSFMYGVAALGKDGGNHTISILKKQVDQVMDQLCCPVTDQLKYHLI